MPCNHVMSDLVELGILTVKITKRKEGKMKMEWDFEYDTEMTSYILTFFFFAIDPHVIYSVEQDVEPGFNKEFLASAVESGLTAVVSSFTLLRVLVVCECWSLCLSVRITDIDQCVSPKPHARPV